MDYYREYLHSLSMARKSGVNVQAYFAWSLLDNFEWADGYEKRFGMVYVDYKDNQKRYVKDSAKWYGQFIKNHTLIKNEEILIQ